MKCTVTLAEPDEHVVAHVLAQQPLATRHFVARAAVRLGLTCLSRDPALLLKFVRHHGGAAELPAPAPTSAPSDDKVQSVEELTALGIKAVGAASNPFADEEG